ncbi:MAG: ADP-ribosylglycohydrolase family protein [Rhodocyclaceae bacterium]|nr:ADP-ribosylglycohydrolase family protein [Rhodocyclaceae bacterium]
MKLDRNARAILGALVADAASLGLHWLYDGERLADIALRGEPVFLPPDRANYEDAKGVFVHAARRCGDFSFYGEACALMLRQLAEADGRFQRVTYQSMYRRHFGPGGAYIGYIDKPTRGTLIRLMPHEDSSTYPQPSGVDDDQLPALAAIPPIVVAAFRCGREDASLWDEIEHVVRVTNNNERAVEAGRAAGLLLVELLRGRKPADAVEAAASRVEEALATRMRDAIQGDRLDAVSAAARFGAACHVEQGLPVICHIVTHAGSYREAVIANIMAGGDSCGRSIMLGAAMGARDAVPLGWMARMNRLAEVLDLVDRLEAAPC